MFFQRRPLTLVGEIFGDPEPCLLAFNHQLQTFGPTSDDSVEGECQRHAAGHGAVEHLPVRRPTAVMHGHRARRRGMSRAFARRDDLVGQSARRFLRVGRRIGIASQGECQTDLPVWPPTCLPRDNHRPG
jgi:hypothetical protein